MKRFKEICKVLVIMTVAASLMAAYAANHRTQTTASGDTTFFYPNSTNTKTFQFDDAYATNVFYTILRSGVSVRVTADTGADTLNATGHGFSNSDKIILTAATEPTGLSLMTEYYVVSTAAESFKLSATDGGAAIDITGAGSGIIAHKTANKIIPQGTNSVTSALNASFASSGPGAWALSDGAVGIGSIAVRVRGSSVLTNAVTFKFQKSVDGLTFGTGANDTFSFDVTPTTSEVTLSTNIPANFMQAAKFIRLYQVVIGTNTTGTGNLYISGPSVNGYVP